MKQKSILLIILLLTGIFLVNVRAQNYCGGYGGWCNCPPNSSNPNPTSQSPINISTWSASTSNYTWSFSYNFTATNDNDYVRQFISPVTSQSPCPVEVDILPSWPGSSNNSITITNTGSPAGVPLFLSQVHLHIPSEHQINGQNYAYELHYVFHNNTQTLVMAVFGNFSGTIDNTTNTIFNDIINAAKNNTVTPGTLLSSNISLNTYLSSSTAFAYPYYTYSGTNTTGGCSLAVTWLVCATPLNVSLPAGITPNNFIPTYILPNRPVQNKYNNNTVYYHTQ